MFHLFTSFRGMPARSQGLLLELGNSGTRLCRHRAMGPEELHKPFVTAGCWQRAPVSAAEMVHHWRAGRGLRSQANLSTGFPGVAKEGEAEDREALQPGGTGCILRAQRRPEHLREAGRRETRSRSSWRIGGLAYRPWEAVLSRR